MQVDIHVTEGPARGQHFTFTRPDCFLVGRAADAHISLPDDPYLSRQHFLLMISPPDCKLTDLDSKNGVFVNGVRYGGRKPPRKKVKMAPNGVRDVCLKDGDLITVGNTRIKVSIRRDHDQDVLADEKQQGADESFGQLLRAEGYQVEQKLSQSSQGTMYKATETETGRTVAIKAIPLQVAMTTQKTAQFQRELDIIRQLKHKNIVRLMGNGRLRNLLYFVSEFVNGPDLSQILRSQNGCLSVEHAASVFLGILDGLTYAHRVKITLRAANGTSKTFRGIVHRDLKPHNILLARGKTNWIPKLSDFGLSRGFEVAGFTNITGSGDMFDAPMYWPREQITHYTHPTLATDVFSIAAVFYEMLTGCWVREGFKELLSACKQERRLPSISDYMNIIATHPPVPIRKRNPDIPEAIASVIDQALCEEETSQDSQKMQEALKHLRYPDSGAFREALLRAFKEAGVNPSAVSISYAYETERQPVTQQQPSEQTSAGSIMYSVIRSSAKREVALFVLDVVQSTQHVINMGDTYFGQLIGGLFRRIKTHPTSSELVFLKCTGDGFLAVFHSIPAAFTLASSFLDEPLHPQIHVRMALHWGAVKTGPNGDVLGTEVHKVCRIEGVKQDERIQPEQEGAAFPAEDRILISQQGLACLGADEQTRFSPAGTFRLKGFDEPCKLWVYPA